MGSPVGDVGDTPAPSPGRAKTQFPGCQELSFGETEARPGKRFPPTHTPCGMQGLGGHPVQPHGAAAPCGGTGLGCNEVCKGSAVGKLRLLWEVGLCKPEPVCPGWDDGTRHLKQSWAQSPAKAINPCEPPQPLTHPRQVPSPSPSWCRVEALPCSPGPTEERVSGPGRLQFAQQVLAELGGPPAVLGSPAGSQGEASEGP